MSKIASRLLKSIALVLAFMPFEAISSECTDIYVEKIRFQVDKTIDTQVLLDLLDFSEGDCVKRDAFDQAIQVAKKKLEISASFKSIEINVLKGSQRDYYEVEVQLKSAPKFYFGGQAQMLWAESDYFKPLTFGVYDERVSRGHRAMHYAGMQNLFDDKVRFEILHFISGQQSRSTIVDDHFSSVIRSKESAEGLYLQTYFPRILGTPFFVGAVAGRYWFKNSSHANGVAYFRDETDGTILDTDLTSEYKDGAREDTYTLKFGLDIKNLRLSMEYQEDDEKTHSNVEPSFDRYTKQYGAVVTLSDKPRMFLVAQGYYLQLSHYTREESRTDNDLKTTQRSVSNSSHFAVNYTRWLKPRFATTVEFSRYFVLKNARYDSDFSFLKLMNQYVFSENFTFEGSIGSTHTTFRKSFGRTLISGVSYMSPTFQYNLSFILGDYFPIKIENTRMENP
jgi:hypothetical protein